MASKGVEVIEGRTSLPKETLEGISVSATEGEGLKELQLKIQDEVLKATKQKFYKIVVPADGPQLRYRCSGFEAAQFLQNLKYLHM